MVYLKINGKKISLTEIAEAFGCKDGGSDTTNRCKNVSLVLENGNASLVATAYFDGAAYGIHMDGEVQEKSYYLCNAELPSKSLSTDAIVTRLYCGKSDRETDSPVALMSHNSREDRDETKRILFYDGEQVEAVNIAGKDSDEIYSSSTVAAWRKRWRKR